MSGLIVALQYRLRRTASVLLWVYLSVVLGFAFGHRCGGHFAGASPHDAHEPSVSRAVVSHGTAHHCLACRWQASTLGEVPAIQSPSLQIVTHPIRPPALCERPVAAPHLPIAARGPPLS